MSYSIRLASVALVLLVVAEAMVGSYLSLLPLGGSQLIQMAIVFGLGFAIAELTTLWRDYRASKK